MGGLSNEPIPDLYLPQTEGTQIGDYRFNTSCGVVERPDHHCGDDDLVKTPHCRTKLAQRVAERYWYC